MYSIQHDYLKYLRLNALSMTTSMCRRLLLQPRQASKFLQYAPSSLGVFFYKNDCCTTKCHELWVLNIATRALTAAADGAETETWSTPYCDLIMANDFKLSTGMFLRFAQTWLGATGAVMGRRFLFLAATPIGGTTLVLQDMMVLAFYPRNRLGTLY
ncbi:hypothetical protein VTO42DRAFT_624 [Malbranchea cinnamomea]